MNTVAKRWRDVTKTDLVQVKGIVYTVAKIKVTDGGKVKVTLNDPQRGSEYKLKFVGNWQAEVVEIRKTKKWSKPDDKAEVNVTEILDATLIAVKPDPDEIWIVPPVDVSTIAAHLYLFHGIDVFDVREPGGYEQAVALHDAEHEMTVESIHVPHTHEAGRPVTTKGPRFT